MPEAVPHRVQLEWLPLGRAPYVIGVSSIRRPARLALITISDANSIPGVRRSRGERERATMRSPQCASDTPVRNST